MPIDSVNWVENHGPSNFTETREALEFRNNWDQLVVMVLTHELEENLVERLLHHLLRSEIQASLTRMIRRAPAYGPKREMREERPGRGRRSLSGPDRENPHGN